MIVYHYTTRTNISEIIQSRRFFPSFFSTALDAIYGEGWYFTDLPPSRSNQELYQIWEQALPERTRCYLVFDIDSEFLVETRPHVYKLALGVISERVLNLNMKYSSEGTIVIQFRRHGYR